MLRNAVALLTGLALGMGLNMGLIHINTTLFFPLPADIDPRDPVAFSRFMQTLPDQAFVLPVMAHLGQSFLGAWTAARLSSSRPMALALALALAVGVLSLAGGVAAMMMIESPVWMLAELPLYLVVAWWAGRLEQHRRLSPAG